MTRCICCGQQDYDLSAGVCFDCASAGEARALQRSVLQHLAKAIRNIWRRKWTFARFDLQWAWGRATRTGDYAPGGYAERVLRGER